MKAMTDREKYLFDLQGFLVVKGVLSDDEVARLNEAIDANMDKRREGKGGSKGSAALDGGPRGEFKDILEWEQPWCQPFRDLLVHKPTIPYLDELLGRGWHSCTKPLIYHSKAGEEGLILHMGNAHFQGGAYYSYQNGRMRNGLMVFQYQLSDVNEGDGGFCAIPGSHKSNFVRPDEITMLQQDSSIVVNPATEAGDLLIFSEATAHGSLPWKGEQERRTAVYRFGPKWVQYGPGYHESVVFPEWVNELTEAQRAVLEPAYFYNRALFDEDLNIKRPLYDDEEPPYRYSEIYSH